VTIKAILDTNVIISGIFWKGAPFEILKAWHEHRFRLAITLPILNEYRRVLDEMTKKHPLPVLSSILEVIELYSEMVEPVSLAGTVCSDPDDDKFLEAALALPAAIVNGEPAARPVRRPLPAHLPREVRIYPPKQEACPDCGGELKHLGEDVSEMLEIEPVRFKVIRQVRPKLACACCERIVQAEARVGRSREVLRVLYF